MPVILQASLGSGKSGLHGSHVEQQHHHTSHHQTPAAAETAIKAAAAAAVAHTSWAKIHQHRNPYGRLKAVVKRLIACVILKTIIEAKDLTPCRQLTYRPAGG